MCAIRKHSIIVDMILNIHLYFIAPPLKLFKYTTDIKINASREGVIEQLRDLMREQKFPMCIKKNMKISSANIASGKSSI